MARLHLTNLPETLLKIPRFLSVLLEPRWLLVACLLWLLPFSVHMKQGLLGITHPSGWVSFGKPGGLWWCQSLCQAVKCTVCDNGVRNQQNPNALSVPALSAALSVGVGHWGWCVLVITSVIIPESSSGCDEKGWGKSPYKSKRLQDLQAGCMCFALPAVAAIVWWQNHLAFS